jgi:hypothetical protein
MHLAWLTGQIDTWSVKMTPTNMCLQIVDTSGFTAGCFYHAINCIVRCNVKPQKELAPLRVKMIRDKIDEIQA